MGRLETGIGLPDSTALRPRSSSVLTTASALRVRLSASSTNASVMRGRMSGSLLSGPEMQVARRCRPKEASCHGRHGFRGKTPSIGPSKCAEIDLKPFWREYGAKKGPRPRVKWRSRPIPIEREEHLDQALGSGPGAERRLRC